MVGTGIAAGELPALVVGQMVVMVGFIVGGVAGALGRT